MPDLNPPIRALLFDFDGTLVDTEAQGFEAVRKGFEMEGITLSPEESTLVVGRKNDEAVHLLCQQKHVSEQKSIQIFRNFIQIYLGLIRQEVTWVAGAKACIESCASQFRCAIVSGSLKEHIEEILQKENLLQHFEFILGAKEYHYGKPDKEPYLAAIKRMNLTPKECLVFEDSDPGIDSAKAAGCRLLVLTSTNKFTKKYHLADYLVKDLSTITADWIKKLGEKKK